MDLIPPPAPMEDHLTLAPQISLDKVGNWDLSSAVVGQEYSMLARPSYLVLNPLWFS